MRCITPDEGCVILQDIHARICGSHMGARLLIGKTNRQGFFWPTVVSDADSLVVGVKVVNFLLSKNTCRLINYKPYTLLGLFSIWALDLVDLFKKAKGGFTHIFIAMDKFTKWIKVKPRASITAAKAMEFIKGIMHRFGVPNNISTDNGTKFTVSEVKDFCADSGIKINYASVSHPQSNGQVEHCNGMIL
jgi:hypothetical protein